MSAPSQSQPLAKTAPSTVVRTTGDISKLLEKPEVARRISLSLPKHLTAERFVRVALMAVQRQPKLLKCTQESLLECLYRLSAMGLEPNGRDAHLIPFEKSAWRDNPATVVCTLIVDYKGLVQLIRRSGEVGNFHADVVCEHDKFSYCYGSDHHLRHVPALTDRGNPLLAYSYVKLVNGGEDFMVMSWEEIMAIRNRSQGYKSAVQYQKKDNPWMTDEFAMAGKTVIRKHSKTLPVSPDLREAIEADDDERDPLDTMKRVGTPGRATFNADDEPPAATDDTPPATDDDQQQEQQPPAALDEPGPDPFAPAATDPNQSDLPLIDPAARRKAGDPVVDSRKK